MVSSPRSTLSRSAPYFPVADVAESAAYYERVFGFRVEYIGGTPPEFAIVSRDGLPIMLRSVRDAGAIVPNERQGGTWDVFFWSTDLRSLFDELRANGADVVYEPKVQSSYGMLEFAVRDSNGHVLGFGESISGES
jgi:uncharacterized glyoxalase superfamily protein PhnB